jgi:histidinol-phosphate aminotransferase
MSAAARTRDGLRDVSPYSSPQLDVPVRLNTNECPYPLPAGFTEDLAAAVRGLSLNRYPSYEFPELRAALAASVGHPVAGTWAATGSNEIILELLQAYGGPGRTAMVFTPTYALHARLSWVTHTSLAEVDLDETFLIGSEQVAAAAALRPDVVFVCSPNNPTGNAQPVDVVRTLASALPESLIVVDEAYIEFGGQTALGLWQAHPNVAVVRTMSKAFALAGARVGYCLAAPEVIEDLRRVRLPYHLSALTQAAAMSALAHRDDALRILDAIRGQRDRILDALAQTDGVTVWPSDANFVLFRPPGDTTVVWQELLDRGVLVRDMTASVPGCLRVTAGTPEEVDAFLAALKEVLA